MKITLLLLTLLSTLLLATPKSLDKVSLQPMRLDQFQFAGYYIAKEKGFYEEVGLDVEIKEFKKMNTVDEVMSSRATFGIGHLSLVKSRSDGEKIVLLSATFQSSPFVLKEKNISDIVFSPVDEGFYFNPDILFTSQKEVEEHPKRVENFRDASLRGWRYTFENMQESIKIVHEKYNPTNKSIQALRYEAEELRKLAFVDGVKFGEISEEKILRIYDMYKILGVAKDKIEMGEFIFNKHSNILNAKELAYLRDKKEITFCIVPFFLPYSHIKDGELEGVESGILEIISKSVPIDFRLIYSKTWDETLSLVKKRKCDFLPIVENIESRREYLDFTTPYFRDSIAIITDNTKDYIIDISSVLDKEFSIVEGYSFIETLRKKYPHIKLNEVSSRKKGFMGVQTGKYYAHIDAMMVAAYYMQNHPKSNLKISGQFEENVKISFGVKKDDEILFSIFQKIANELKQKDIHRVLSEWVSIKHIRTIDHAHLKNVLLFTFTLALIIGYRQYLLKKKNKQLQSLQNQLLILNKSLEIKVADAVNDVLKKDAYLLHQSRLAQMGEMLSMIAHQWKQPLSSISAVQISIRMAIELERFDLRDEKQREEFLEFVHKKLDKIATNTKNLSQIISNFSDFYKPNKKAEVLKLDEVIMKAYSLVEDNMDANNISISMSLHSDAVVRLHENEFTQVILNLLNNARDQVIERRIEDAKIKIKSYDENGDTVLEISDNALGIDEEIIENVFDPYFSTKLDKNGTGLGLYMSKQIIEEHHNGNISVKNDKDGAVFTIRLEVAEDNAK